MNQSKKISRKVISALLSLLMVLSCFSGMGLTAFAAGDKAYAAYDVTTETNKTKSGNALTALQVTFNERKWYIIEDNSSSATSGTVTLLSADTTFGTKTFDNNENSSNKYSTSQVKDYLDSMTGTDGAFADVAEAIETVNLTTNKYDSTNDTNDVYETVNGVKLYLLSVEEASSLPANVLKAGFTGGDCQFNDWWLRSPSYADTSESDAAYVWGDDGIVCADGASVNYSFGVRPALQLDLSKVEFDSSSKTFAMAKSAYADLKNTTTVITFDNKQWYLIEDNSTSETEGTVTLLAKECVGASKFGSNNTYSGSTLETYVNNWYTSNISADAKAAVDGNGMFLLTTDQAQAITNKDVLKCSKASEAQTIYWWLCSPVGSKAASVSGNLGDINGDDVGEGSAVGLSQGVRPALKLNLSKVEFDSEAKTFAVVKSAYADYLPAATDDATALAAKVVKFNGYDWYLIEDNSKSETEGAVTLFAADDSFGLSKFSDSYSNAYSCSKIKAALDAMTAEDGDFANVARAIVSTALEDVTVPRAKLYLLSTSEAQNLNPTILNYDFPGSASKGAWWLRSPGTNSDYASCVYGDEGRVDGTGYNIREACGVRPALKLDLSKAEFDSETKTFAVPNSGAYAGYVPAEADDATALAAKVVKFNGHDWYLIEDNSKSKTKGTVTLFAKECVGVSKFGDNNTYSGSTLESYVNSYYADNFSAAAQAAVSEGLFILTKEQAQTIHDTNVDVLKCSQADGAASNKWWLSSSGSNKYYAAYVYGDDGNVSNSGSLLTLFGVRPALKLDLSKVEFDSETKTFAVPTPGAYADYLPAEADDATALAAKVVKFNGYDWYLIKDKSTSETEGTVTLFAKDFIGNSKFDDSSDKYSESAVKEYLDNLTNAEGTFAGVADAIKTVETLTTKGYDSDDVYDTVSNVKLYLLSTSEAYKLPVNIRKCGYSGYWWLRSPGKRIDNDDFDIHTASAALVDGYDYNNGEVYEEDGPIQWELGVRPALKLDLSQVTFASVRLSGGANAAKSEGTAIQNYFVKGNTRGAMTAVTYTANEGYMFPVESNSYGTSDGITVTRTSDTVITVSGTPTETVTSIAVPDAVLAHTHDFSYSTGYNAIIAECTADGCTLDDGTEQHNHIITLNIVAPTLTTYGQTGEGISAEATLDGLDAFNAATGLNVSATDIKYYEPEESFPGYTRPGEELEGAPTDAGTYFAGITLSNVKISETDTSNVSAYVSYTIAKADPTCTAPTGLTATYGQTLADVTLTNPSGNTAGTWAWADSRTSVGNAGTNTFEASFVPTDTANYNTKTNIDVSVTVGKADPTYTVPTGLEATYGDTLSSVTLPTGWSWANGSQKVGNADTKTFKATYTPADTDNYNVVNNIDVTVTVNKADINPTVSITGWTYGQAANSPSVSGNTGDGHVKYTYAVKGSDEFSETVPTDANTYTVKAAIAATTNYNGKSVTADFTIAKANPTANDFVFSEPDNLNYDGNNKTATVIPQVGIDGMGDATVKYYSDAARTNEVDYAKNAGTYYVGITVNEGDNYNATSAVLYNSGWKFTVAKANPTANDFTFSEPDNLNYDGNNKTATVIPQVGVDGMGNATVKYYSDAARTNEVDYAKNAGTYYVGITVNEGDNYNATSAVLYNSGWKFTVAKANIAPTVTLDGWTYGDEANLPTVTGNSGNGDVTYLYKEKGASDMSCTDEVPTQAGEYTVKALIAETANYNGANAEADFTIAKAKVTVTADDKTSKREAALKELTYKVDGKILDGDDLGIKVTSDVKAAVAGKYDIKVAYTENANYDVTTVDGIYTVTDRITTNERTKGKNKINSAAKATVNKNGSITAKWGAVANAEKFEVYAGYCDGDYKMIKSVKGDVHSFNITKLNKKALNQKKSVKIYVVAYRKVNGKYEKITQSVNMHIAGKANKHTNAKAIKVKKSSYTLKVNKTATIKPTLVLQNSKKKAIEHVAKFRYQSTNKAVATVDANGKIKAVGKGTCTIYIFANNGKLKSVKVTVK